MSEVVPIHSGVVVVDREPVPEMVAELEDWLQRARAGELQGLAMVAYNADASTTWSRTGVSTRSMVGSMFAMMQRMSVKIDSV